MHGPYKMKERGGGGGWGVGRYFHWDLFHFAMGILQSAKLKAPSSICHQPSGRMYCLSAHTHSLYNSNTSNKFCAWVADSNMHAWLVNNQMLGIGDSIVRLYVMWMVLSKGGLLSWQWMLLGLVAMGWHQLKAKLHKTLLPSPFVMPVWDQSWGLL